MIDEWAHDRVTTDDALMRTIGFTRQDFLANQGGSITPHQRRRLSRPYHRWLFGTLACVAGGLLLAVLLLTQTDMPNAYIFVVIGLFALAGYALYHALQYRRDLRQPEIRMIRGKLKAGMGTYDRTVLTVSIANKTFEVSRPVFLAFKNGDPYTIYYTPHSKTILSAESLREG